MNKGTSFLFRKLLLLLILKKTTCLRASETILRLGTVPEKCKHFFEKTSGIFRFVLIYPGNSKEKELHITSCFSSKIN